MKKIDQDILVRNGFIDIPGEADAARLNRADFQPNAQVATILQNLASYGYTLDASAFAAINDAQGLVAWWKAFEPVLRNISGANRNMGDFIVYKNFPREVLDMDAALQVFFQIAIYHGADYDWVREEEESRKPLGEMARLKVLTLADNKTGDAIFANLQAMRNRWNDNQNVWAKKLIGDRNAVVFTDYGFKENAVQVAVDNFDKMELVPSSATDVLRVCAGVSGGDISLRETVRLRRFKRPERRRLLATLDTQTNLIDDMAMRPGPWKRLMEHLRPGDYKRNDGRYAFQNVVTAYDDLYNGKTKTMNALLDPQQPDETTLDAAVARPGAFLRRFHYYYGLFGTQAVDRLLPLMERLSTHQLARLRGYLRTINDRVTMIYPPKSNWSKAQVEAKGKTRIAEADLRRLNEGISAVLSKRLAAKYPEGIALDLRVDQVKLQTNDQKLAEYGRGTTFDIPENVRFVRSASFWQHGQASVVWYDNGWNFFDDNWQSLGTCAWNSQQFGKAAVFSGDPVNIRDFKGRACQMADLYLDELEARGVRFCVWNVLCYSRQKFSEATEVLATLQWGENAEEGRTYEPSRAQMVFPLKSESYTSYVAYLDLKLRKLVYMDVAFRGNTQSADSNAETLQTLMPAYVEYLDALPTVLEVVQDAPAGTMPVRFDDADAPVTAERAYVFQPVNAESRFKRLSVTDLVED